MWCASRQQGGRDCVGPTQTEIRRKGLQYHAPPHPEFFGTEVRAAETSYGFAAFTLLLGERSIQPSRRICSGFRGEVYQTPSPALMCACCCAPLTPSLSAFAMSTQLDQGCSLAPWAPSSITLMNCEVRIRPQQAPAPGNSKVWLPAACLETESKSGLSCKQAMYSSEKKKGMNN